MDPVVALHHCGGVASWARLRALGVTPYAVRRAKESGAVCRLRRGVHALRGADPRLVTAARLGGVLCCTTAAAMHELPVLVPVAVHVTVPRAWGHTLGAGVGVHRRSLADDEHDGLCTGLLRTTLDCARELPFQAAVAVCDAALHKGLLPSRLRSCAAVALGPGSRALRRVVAAADGRAESPIETLLRLLALPLAAVEPQVVIDRVGRVDLLLDGWLVLEADGFAFHSDRQSYRNDRRRANALVRAGYEVLRFSYEDIVEHPDHVRATIVDVLRRGPRSSFTPGHTMPLPASG